MSKPFRIKRSVDGQFYFTVTAFNNKVLMTSETYKLKLSAEKAIKSLCRIVVTETSANTVEGECIFENLIQDETVKHGNELANNGDDDDDEDDDDDAGIVVEETPDAGLKAKNICPDTEPDLSSLPHGLSRF